MANNFQRGDLCPVYFQATGAAASQRINITGWNGDLEAARYLVTHTGTEGCAARIAGTEDGRGTVNGDYDMDLPPYASVPYIRQGISGIILCYVSSTKAIQIPIIIAKVHYESQVGSQVKWSFDWEYNKLAGNHVYPAA